MESVDKGGINDCLNLLDYLFLRRVKLGWEKCAAGINNWIIINRNVSGLGVLALCIENSNSTLDSRSIYCSLDQWFISCVEVWILR